MDILYSIFSGLIILAIIMPSAIIIISFLFIINGRKGELFSLFRSNFYKKPKIGDKYKLIPVQDDDPFFDKTERLEDQYVIIKDVKGNYVQIHYLNGFKLITSWNIQAFHYAFKKQRNSHGNKTF